MLAPLFHQRPAGAGQTLFKLDPTSAGWLRLKRQPDVGICYTEAAGYHQDRIDRLGRIKHPGLNNIGVCCPRAPRPKPDIHQQGLPPKIRPVEASGVQIDPEDVPSRDSGELFGQRDLRTRTLSVDEDVSGGAAESPTIVPIVEGEAWNPANHVFDRHRIESREELGRKHL